MRNIVKFFQKSDGMKAKYPIQITYLRFQADHITPKNPTI